jgi:hypothetical protein
MGRKMFSKLRGLSGDQDARSSSEAVSSALSQKAGLLAFLGQSQEHGVVVDIFGLTREGVHRSKTSYRRESIYVFEKQTVPAGSGLFIRGNTSLRRDTSCNVQSTAPSRFSLAHPLPANHLSHGNDGRHHGRVRVPHGDEHVVVEEKMIWQVVDREDHGLQRIVLVARLDRCQGEDVGRLMDVILSIWRPVSHDHDR